MKEYTEKELVEIGRKAIASRQKQAEKDKATRTLQKQLMDAYKAGLIKLPKK